MTTKTPSIEYALQYGSASLQAGESPQLDARVLLCHVLQCERSYLLTWPERTLNEAQWSRYCALIAQRKEGMPVAYLTGTREFWSLPLCVSSATLIPRPDTEVLVEQALQRLSNNDAVSVLDLGTGTGAIALALASELPKVRVFGGDVQADAVALAKHNAEQLNLQRVEFRHGSWFAPFAAMQFDMVVSNPPYIDAHDHHLQQGDVRFEPLSALVAEEHGLADIRHIIDKAKAHLKVQGWLLFEHGYEQGEMVRTLLCQAGFVHAFTAKDYGDNDRVTGAQWLA